MIEHLSVAQVIKKAGGIAGVVRIMGYPINRYTVEGWRRRQEIPAVYRGKLAEGLGLKVEQLEPDYEGRLKRIRYQKMAAVYKSMVAAANINTSYLPKLHRVSKERVDRWRWGMEEVPFSAIEDVYRQVQSKTQKMTIALAKEMTGLNQTEIAARLGLSPAMATYWRKLGEIPPQYAEEIRTWKRSGTGELNSSE
jgi:hypothetical protein